MLLWCNYCMVCVLVLFSVVYFEHFQFIIQHWLRDYKKLATQFGVLEERS